MGVRAYGMAVVLLVATGAQTNVAALAEDGLVLSPARGTVGETVTGEQAVNQCATYRLRWDDENGSLLGVDSGSDGRGTVSFTVPEGPETTHTVVATCQSSSGADEAVVGGAVFVVHPAPTPGPKNTSTTSFAATTTTAVPTTAKRGPTTTTRTGPPPPTSTTMQPPSLREPPGRAPAPRPGTEAAPRLPQDIADCERQARQAKSQLVYQPNRRMTIGASYDVEVKLALDVSDVSAASIPGPDRTTIVQLRTSRCTIQAELTGADFDVTPPQARPQSFLDARVLTWRWQVTPKRTGPNLKLVLRLQPTVVEDGKSPRPGSEDFHEALIEVASQDQSLIAEVGDRANRFVESPLVKLLLVPSGGGLLTLLVWRQIRRRQTDGV